MQVQTLLSLLAIITSFVPFACAQSMTYPTDAAGHTISNNALETSYLSAQSSRYTLCGQILSTCQPTIASCASTVCSLCTGLGQQVINSCCSQGQAPTACFQTASRPHTSAITGATPQNTANPGTLLSNPGYQACQSAQKYSSICESLSPGFATETIFAYQAPCLCYDNTTWAPQVFDGFVQTCQSYISSSTSSPANTMFAPCSAAGNVVASLSSYDATHNMTTAMPSATTTPTITATSVTVPKSEGSRIEAKFNLSVFQWAFHIIALQLVLFCLS